MEASVAAEIRQQLGLPSGFVANDTDNTAEAIQEAETKARKKGQGVDGPHKFVLYTRSDACGRVYAVTPALAELLDRHRDRYVAAYIPTRVRVCICACARLFVYY